MRIHYSAASPYVRKCVAVALHHGLPVERVPSNPHLSPDHLLADNPLSKVPSLVTDEGLALNDSPIICEYLDHIGTGPKLFPAPGPARWKALAMAALADGILDAAVGRRLSSQFPQDEGRQKYDARQKAAITRALDALEAGELSGPLDIGKLGVVCALGYLDFRFGQEDWRGGRSKLAAFYEAQLGNRIFADTMPQG
ncbi:glutathione S-transferase N-terminal domain-containing protein [Rubritepida flocculans]|uniref:glutathione S-transferase N-terminal domain-containing protein n=1 Tax=Rubritepida flocculans TaxID=182403 RepID=UPI0004148F64|nr:glutathione S-transferase N-terminal domain-containing protein [Rubritepida flocculans]